MSKKCYRYFGLLLQKQEKWLDKMAERGYRLTAVDKMLYEFEECNPGSVEYRVEYIGSKSKSNGREYFQFLEEMGYFIFFLLLGIVTKVVLFALFGVIPLVPALVYHHQIRTLEKESISEEW